MHELFRKIFRQNLWGDPESVSGPGSGVARTAAFRDDLLSLLKDIEARSLLDAGCGDFNWLKEVALACDYTGIDIVGELIEHDQKYSDDGRRFVQGDIRHDPLPCVDVILCRDCLAHFSFADVQAALGNFKRSESRYLLTTSFVARCENADIVTGDWWPINLECAPFGFPPPWRSIDEKCLHTSGIYADKRLALWRIADIPQAMRA